MIEAGKPVVLGGEKESTNIRMEGRALVAALDYLDGDEAEIYTDSEFWINVITKWAPGWQARGWTKKGGEIKNLDIVKEVFAAYQMGQANLIWVRGHVGHEGNELADVWANKARAGERV